MKRLAALTLLTALVVLWPRASVASVPFVWSPAPWPAAVIPTVLLGVEESDRAVRSSGPVAPLTQAGTGLMGDAGVMTPRVIPGQGHPNDTHLASGSASSSPSPAVASTRPTPSVSEPAHTLAELVFEGIVSHMGASQGPGYLAIPKGPGWIVRLCGPGGCITRTSTDAGPSLAEQRAGRIADLYVGDFVAVCGVPASMGLCDATLTVLRRTK